MFLWIQVQQARSYGYGRYDINATLQALSEADIPRCEVEIVNDSGNLGAMIFGKKISSMSDG